MYVRMKLVFFFQKKCSYLLPQVQRFPVNQKDDVRQIETVNFFRGGAGSQTWFNQAKEPID